MTREDKRVNIKFIEKEVIIKNEKTGEEEKFIEFFKSPDKKIYKAGDEQLVTRKHAIWLAANGFIEPLKKENKKAAKRETK